MQITDGRSRLHAVGLEDLTAGLGCRHRWTLKERCDGGSGIVVQWVTPLPIMLAFHMGAGLYAGCSRSDPAPCQRPGKAVEDGLTVLSSATHVGDPEEAPKA